MSARVAAGLLGCLGLAACGLGGGSGGGGSELPVSGAGPYGKLTDFELATPIDEPFVIVAPGIDLTDPSPVARPSGMRVFYTRRPRDGAGEIWRSDLPSLAEASVGAAAALVASEPWEAGAVAAPSVVEDGDRLVLYYEGGAGGVGRAESTDGGDSWRKTGRVLEDAGRPGALHVRGVWRLYFTRPSRPGIFLAESADGVTFTAADAPVLAGRGGDAFDVTLADPMAAGGETAAGELHIGLFYTGADRLGRAAVGFAASDDGRTFLRAPEAILDPEPPDERAPAVLLEPSRAVLFYSEARAGATAIGAATSP